MEHPSRRRILGAFAMGGARPTWSQENALVAQYCAIEARHVGKLIVRQLAAESEQNCNLFELAIATQTCSLEAICSSTATMCFMRKAVARQNPSSLAVIISRDGKSVIAKVEFEFVARVLALNLDRNHLTLCYSERQRHTDWVKVFWSRLQILRRGNEIQRISRATALGEFYEPMASIGGNSVVVGGYGPNLFRAWRDISEGSAAGTPFLEGTGSASVSPDGGMFAVFAEGQSPELVSRDLKAIAKLEMDIKPGIKWIGNNDTALRIRPRIDSSLLVPARLEAFSVQSGQVLASCFCRPILPVSGYLAFNGHKGHLETALEQVEHVFEQKAPKSRSIA